MSKFKLKQLVCKIFSKRNVLFMVNVIFLIFISICCYLYVDEEWHWGTGDYKIEKLIIVFKFMLIQCLVTFLSLIVYYLAIMAGALNSKYKEEVKDTEYEDKQ